MHKSGMPNDDIAAVGGAVFLAVLVIGLVVALVV